MNLRVVSSRLTGFFFGCTYNTYAHARTHTIIYRCLLYSVINALVQSIYSFDNKVKERERETCMACVTGSFHARLDMISTVCRRNRLYSSERQHQRPFEMNVVNFRRRLPTPSTTCKRGLDLFILWYKECSPPLTKFCLSFVENLRPTALYVIQLLFDVGLITASRVQHLFILGRLVSQGSVGFTELVMCWTHPVTFTVQTLQYK